MEQTITQDGLITQSWSWGTNDKNERNGGKMVKLHNHDHEEQMMEINEMVGVW